MIGGRAAWAAEVAAAAGEATGKDGVVVVFVILLAQDGSLLTVSQ